MKNFIKLFALSVFAILLCAGTFVCAQGYCSSDNVTSVRASHILVDTKAQAITLKSEIDNGASFENLAKKYSKCPSGENGGDLGYFERGQMVPEFEQVAFSTPVGQVSDPVRTQFGWHLIKVTDRR